MTTLRAEALQIINEMPDYVMASLVQNLRTFKDENFDSLDSEIDSRKMRVANKCRLYCNRQRQRFYGVTSQSGYSCRNS